MKTRERFVVLGSLKLRLNHLIILPLLFSFTYEEDVLGCGGFVKSDFGINYSRVEIKLYSKQGSLKYQTDCAPNNGYYLIPLYDKGDYILKVEPPGGWGFEPTTVALHVDGVKDACSRGEDINFVFKGFSIFGKVVSKGSDNGPAGISIFLKTVNGELLQETKTVVGGDYSFSNILPGEYLVEASHTKWRLENYQEKITISQDNGKIGSGIVVGGYDVRGEVRSEGEPIRGVHFILFDLNDSSNILKIQGCDSNPVKGYNIPSGMKYLCQVTSGTDGKFVFSSVPPGKYQLYPFYKGENIEFDVSPSVKEFTVEHGSIEFKEKFQVQGFSVSGKVFTGIKGKPLSGAKILLDNKEEALTDQDGVYHLDNMKAGSYRLDVQAHHFVFEPVTVKVTPNTPELPEVAASQLDLCGQLIISHVPSGVIRETERSILVTQENKKDELQVMTGKDGKFCLPVTPGKYILTPALSEKEQLCGLKFVPAEVVAIVSDSPVLDVTFSQFRGSIKGIMKCLTDCDGVQLALEAVSSQNPTSQITIVDKKHFSFEGLLPTTYELSVVKDEWCWKKKIEVIDVVDKDVADVQFEQTGFLMLVTSSHFTEAELVHPSEYVEKIEVPQGTSMHCLPLFGVYSLKPTGCHLFKEEVFWFDTLNPSTITLLASKHLIGGIVLSEENITSIVVSVQKENDEKDTERIILQNYTLTKDNLFEYHFTFWAQPRTALILTPLSEQILFHPPSIKFFVPDDCSPDSVSFKGKTGLFIHGKVIPPLEGVKITVSEVSGQQQVISMITDAKGSYVVGPLDSDLEYNVGADKEGYIFSKLEKQGNFAAFKLAEVDITVQGEAKEALSGVLVSLSGGLDYRKNSMTQTDGRLVFSGLSPGQYFLKPMMKEYQFEPPSKMIEVKEGATVEMNISGKRIAFSCFGVVNSLTGEAEPGVAVEAVGHGSDYCQQFQEEALSEQDGTFRIRGLIPGCNYSISLKKGAESNQHIERAAPKEIIVKMESKDITDLRMIVFRHFNQMDISGNVVTSQEFLSSLKIKLYQEDNLDQAIYTFSLGQSSFFQLPALPLDNRMYILRLDSSLPPSTFHVDSPSISFRANTSYRHMTFHFSPQPRSLEHEMTQGSILALPLTIVIAVLIYNYSKVLPLLGQGVELMQALVNPAKAATVSSAVANSENLSSEPVSGRKKVKPKKI